MFESLRNIVTTTAPDFHVLWSAARDLPTANNPYLNPNIFTGVGYPPSTLFFYLPFANFSYQTAQNIFTLISFLALLCVVYFSLKLRSRKVSFYLFGLFLFFGLLFFPTKFTFGMGQNNLIAFALLVLSYYFFKKERGVYAGFFLGLAISLKTIFGFFLLFYFLKKKWKLLFTALEVVLIFALLVLLISPNGINLFWHYFTKVLPPLMNFEGREIFYNQGIAGFVSRIIVSAPFRKIVWEIVSAVVVITTIVSSLKQGRTDLQFSLFALTLLLIDSLSWQHHFVWSIYSFIVFFSKLAASCSVRPYGYRFS